MSLSDVQHISKTPELLKVIKQRSYKENLDIIKLNGLALEYIDEQTEEICMEAVKQNGKALKFVKIKTEKIYKEAIKYNKDILKFLYEDSDSSFWTLNL